MNISTKYISLIIIAFIIVAAFIFFPVFYGDIFDHDDSWAGQCGDVLPEERRAGITVEFNNGTPRVDINGEVAKNKRPTSDQLHAFLMCLNQAHGGVIFSGVHIPYILPLGKVANDWRRQQGMQLHLMPGDNDEVLNNLRIGPIAASSKAEALDTWCNSEQKSVCVTCSPRNITESAPAVEVKLKDGAPVKRSQIPGNWPVHPIDPNTGNPSPEYKPWELIDREGRRFVYECTPPE